MKLSGKTYSIIAVILLLAAFLGGLIPMSLNNRELMGQINAAQTEARNAQASADAVRQQLREAGLQNTLGLILVEVEQNNFGLAKDRATTFFDDLRQAVATAQNDKARERLAFVLKHRDEITADLTSLNPETASKLRTLYLAFSQETPATK